MDFGDFKKSIAKLSKIELPGEEMQLKMAPIGRIQELKRAAMVAHRPRKAGVMALFYPSGNFETHLILILRKIYKGIHSAQVGFPGGKMEKYDRSLEEAALRETEEEIGVDRKA